MNVTNSKLSVDTKIPYSIETNSLLQKYIPNRFKKFNELSEREKNIVYQKVSEELLELVATDVIWFPFQKYFRGPPNVVFQNLKNIELSVEHQKYNLHSYLPLYNSFFATPFPRATDSDKNYQWGL